MRISASGRSSGGPLVGIAAMESTTSDSPDYLPKYSIILVEMRRAPNIPVDLPFGGRNLSAF